MQQKITITAAMMTVMSSAADGLATAPGAGVTVSNLNYNGVYNVELFLGNQVNEASQGNFTVDTGSASFIVNGDRCTDLICSDYKQFPNPTSKPVVNDTIGYGDGSGYDYNVYRAPVTFKNGETINDVFIAYNYNATANPITNMTDNFDKDTQGIIGLAHSCLNNDKLANLPLFMNHEYPERYPTSSFSMCLNEENGPSKMSWGEQLPEGMPAMDVDFGCGYWKVVYESFELYDVADNLINSVAAAPLEIGEQPFNNCGPEKAMCANAPYLDTGNSQWILNEKDYNGLMSLLTLFYNGKSRDDVVALIQKLVDAKGDFSKLTDPEWDILNEAFTNDPLVLSVVFKGDNKPTITKTMDLEILRSLKPSNRSNLGLSVMNGNIFHFDATNKKLGVQSINSKNGSPLDYLCTSY